MSHWRSASVGVTAFRAGHLTPIALPHAQQRRFPPAPSSPHQPASPVPASVTPAPSPSQLALPRTDNVTAFPFQPALFSPTTKPIGVAFSALMGDNGLQVLQSVKVSGVGQVQHPGGKLAYLAACQGLTLREFMLKNLNKHKSMTAMAKAMDVTPARIRIDMARARDCRGPQVWGGEQRQSGATDRELRHRRKDADLTLPGPCGASDLLYSTHSRNNPPALTSAALALGLPDPALSRRAADRRGRFAQGSRLLQ